MVTRHNETARATSGLLRPAAVRGDVRAMQRAIADGEDVDGVDEDGWTALDFAASLGQMQAAQLLLESGADAAKETPEAR